MNPQLVLPTTFARRQATLASLLTPAATLPVSVSHLEIQCLLTSPSLPLPRVTVVGRRPFSPWAPACRLLPLTCLISRHTMPSWTATPWKRFQRKRVRCDHDHILYSCYTSRGVLAYLPSRRARPSRWSVPCPQAYTGLRPWGEEGP
ncbi:hypothetical protein CCUS01_13488 [Colletotrichum cuscutae]|uniref:Uncharacterized protein n=1 Tax=Colletotrichum cuscutae TaxID=1209917 RepID=A0AAI9YBF1_9PEZI|nr:hypothetical protein CCUS01_13488 [Colletotrichum cuscutae]